MKVKCLDGKTRNSVFLVDKKKTLVKTGDIVLVEPWNLIKQKRYLYSNILQIKLNG
jgi:translation initiation factor IF-1